MGAPVPRWNARPQDSAAFEQYAASLQQEREKYQELASAAESLLSEFSHVDEPNSPLNLGYYRKPYILHQILEKHKEK